MVTQIQDFLTFGEGGGGLSCCSMASQMCSVGLKSDELDGYVIPGIQQYVLRTTPAHCKAYDIEYYLATRLFPVEETYACKVSADPH